MASAGPRRRMAHGMHRIAAEEPTMIAGVITSKDVLLHAPSIIGAYGFRRYVRVLRGVLSRRTTTFLELVW